MKVGNVSTGETIFFDGNFDTAEIIFPNIDNKVFVISGDFAENSNPLVIQEDSPAITPQSNWQGFKFFNHNANVGGHGTINVFKDTNADKLFLISYNAVNHIKDGPNKFWFNIYCYDSASVDSMGNPSRWVMAKGCYFTTLAPFPVSPNNEGIQWSFTAKKIERIAGKLSDEGFTYADSLAMANENNTLWDNERNEESMAETSEQAFYNSASISNSIMDSRAASQERSEENSYQNSLSLSDSIQDSKMASASASYLAYLKSLLASNNKEDKSMPTNHSSD